MLSACTRAGLSLLRPQRGVCAPAVPPVPSSPASRSYFAWQRGFGSSKQGRITVARADDAWASGAPGPMAKSAPGTASSFAQQAAWEFLASLDPEQLAAAISSSGAIRITAGPGAC